MNISQNHRRRTLISLTPLIDVVFILLIFFMRASSFVEWKYIELGVGESESLALNLSTQSLVEVDFNNQYSLNKKALPLGEIINRVREQVRQDLDHPVLIKPVNDLPLQELLTVLDALSQFAESNISLVKDQSQSEPNGH
ncbi:MAG: biopolymer transporter ExbD [Pseudomonadota bacterium]